MIKIICIGKLKEQYLKEGINDYQKRINKYHKLEIIELLDSNIDKEKELILKNINHKDYIITLDIEGTNISSKELANKLDKTFITNPNIITNTSIHIAIIIFLIFLYFLLIDIKSIFPPFI